MKMLSLACPLKRLIKMGTEESGIYLQFTDDHLARHIGKAIHHAHNGQLKLQYLGEDKFVRINWHREV